MGPIKGKKKLRYSPFKAFKRYSGDFAVHVHPRVDAPNADFPRYGDYPGKTELRYIRRLVKQGRYFDLARFRYGAIHS